MAEQQLVVMALIQAKPGNEEEVRRELVALIEPTRKEAGCLNYDLHLSQETRGLFLFHETWRSREDLDRHLQSPHFKRFSDRAAGLVARPAEVSCWERIA